MPELMRGNHAQAGRSTKHAGTVRLNWEATVLPRSRRSGAVNHSLEKRCWYGASKATLGRRIAVRPLHPMLAERVHDAVGRLIWNSFPQLGPLPLPRSLGSHVGNDSAGGVDSLPPFNDEIPLLCLPHYSTRDDTIPATSPYLFADAAASAALKKNGSRKSRDWRSAFRGPEAWCIKAIRSGVST